MTRSAGSANSYLYHAFTRSRAVLVQAYSVSSHGRARRPTTVVRPSPGGVACDRGEAVEPFVLFRSPGRGADEKLAACGETLDDLYQVLAPGADLADAPELHSLLAKRAFDVLTPVSVDCHKQSA